MTARTKIKLRASFSPNIKFDLTRNHYTNRPQITLNITSGAFKYSEVSEMIVALRRIQDEYATQFDDILIVKSTIEPEIATANLGTN